MPAYGATTVRMAIDWSFVICVANLQCDCVRSACSVVDELQPVRRERRIVSHRPGIKHNNLFFSLNSNQFRSADRLTEFWDEARPDPPTLGKIAEVAAAKFLISGAFKQQVKQKAIDRSQISLNRRTEKGKGRATGEEVDNLPMSLDPAPAPVEVSRSPLLSDFILRSSVTRAGKQREEASRLAPPLPRVRVS